MRVLSKSKLLAFRQCPKRLWLEVFRRDLSTAIGASAGLTAGRSVGAVVRQVFDPDGRGELVDVKGLGIDKAYWRSRELLGSGEAIFEGGYAAGGASVFADILLPVGTGDSQAWRMVEVKSATTVKDYHRGDGAIQAYVVRTAGLPLQSVAVAYVDTSWTYPGGEDYRGLFLEEDLIAETLAREAEVRGWIEAAQAVVGSRVEPLISTGSHCWRRARRQGPCMSTVRMKRRRSGSSSAGIRSWRRGLSAVMHRLVDLRPIAEKFYYHPSQQGSWSIKEVLPAITGRGYEELEGIKDGGMAMEAYVEAIDPGTSAERKGEIERQLKAYCALDTEAMVRIWGAFGGRRKI
jgi:hypothetical protein